MCRGYVAKRPVKACSDPERPCAPAARRRVRSDWAGRRHPSPAPPIPGESRWQSAKHVHVQWPAKCGAPEMSCRGAGQAFAPVGSLARGRGPRPPMLPGRSSIGHRKRKTTTHHHVPIANPRLGRPRCPLPARWSSPSYSSRTASTFCPATSPRPDIPGPRGPDTDSFAEGRPGWPNGMRHTP